MQERQDLLDGIGFIFDLHGAKWWGFYEKLSEHKEEYGDTVVPIYQESLQRRKEYESYEQIRTHHSCIHARAVASNGLRLESFVNL